MKQFDLCRKWLGRCFWLLTIALLGPGAFAQQVAKTIPAPFTINNMTGYYEALPADYTTSGKPHPLIIFLHGRGELAGASATSVTSSVTNTALPKYIKDGKFPASFTVNGQTHSFIVISPQFKNWPGSGEVFQLLKYLKTYYRIDTNRIYITGLSMGGGVAWGALSENADSAKQIAAAVVICGAWDPSGVTHLPPRIAANNTPVLATHNDLDNQVPLSYSQGWVNGINNTVPANKYPARLTVWSSTSHDAWTKTYDPNYKDPVTGLNVYEWMLQYSKGTTSVPPPTGTGGKRITVRTTSANIIYYDNAMTQLGAKPGDTLCIPPGDYEYIHFAKLIGTAEKPVVITNCGGLVRVGVNSSATAASFVFNTSKYIKVEGTGAPAIKYGFDVNGTNKNGQKMFGAFFGSGTTDFEVHHVYIHDAGMFLQAKTLQQCDHPEWLDPVFTMRNVKIHDLLCRNSAWEGFYIGNTHYLWSNGTCTDLASHRIENIQVYNNDLENMGSDGMQISVADKGDNRIYGNRVVNYAMMKNSPHGYGILSGGGSALRIYNNFISKGYNSAIEIFGAGINHVYNNVITDIKFEGINVSDKNLFAPATAYIYNNTVIRTGVNGLKIYADQTTLGHKVYNNLVIAPGTAWDRPLNGYYIQGSKPVLYDFANNLNFKTLEEAGFLDPNSGNFRLKAGSGAIDAGRNMADLGLTTDFDGTARPYNNTFDVGAFEYNSSVPAQFTIANAGKDQQIALPTTSITLTGSATTTNGGTISSYNWKKVSGPNQGTIASANSASTQVTGMVAGTYVFELKATNNAGGSAADMITVSVLTSANKPPAPTAGGDVVLTLPSNATQLTGSFSLDPDGVIVSYLWERISGPAAGSILDVNASNTDLSGLTAGVYVYRLTVVDNGGLTASDDVTITVQGATTNKPPVANAGADQSVRMPVSTIVLDGSASADPDGTIASYSWKKISGPEAPVLATPSAAKTNVTTFTVAGEYVFELTVKDNENTTATDQVKITVTPGDMPPVAKAGNDQTARLPVATLVLDGSGSTDADGPIASYAWKKLSGPAGGTLATPAAAKTNVTDLTIAGEYVFELTVKDDNNATATDQVKITITAANVPPVANAGYDISITLPVNNVVLDARSSDDADGTIASYAWRKASGPAAGGTSIPATAQPEITGLAAGTYSFEVTVTDNDGATHTDAVTVTVLPAPNVPPVADAGVDQSISLPVSSVTLDGRASKDADGTIASYSWRKLSGPAEGGASIAATVQPNVTGLVEGVYLFQLTVTDNDGATHTDEVTVTVLSAPNVAPVADAGANQTITLPASSVVLDGRASRDTDGNIASYAWRKLSGPSAGATSIPASAQPNVTGLVEGTYVFQLTVTDNDGATHSDDVTVTVLAAPNVPPVANAGANQTITLPVASVVLDASGSRDSDGSISSYAWRKISGPSAGGTSIPGTARPNVTGLVEGIYVFQLTVTDNKGATNSSEVRVTVLAEPNTPPVANAGINQSITLPTSSTTLDGSGSTDGDGTITKYAWRKISGPADGLILSAAAARTDVSGLNTAGTYVYELTVTDNRGATHTARVTVTVQPQPNQSPVASIDGETTIRLPLDYVFLDGINSRDPDGAITGFQWKQLSGPGNAVFSRPDKNQTRVSGLVEGVYEIELTVTDNLEATAKTTHRITVQKAEDNKEENPFTVYPNPAVSYVRARMIDPIGGEVIITIYDDMGRVVKVLKDQSDPHTVYQREISIEEFRTGTYLLELRSNNQKWVRRFVKVAH